MTRFDAEHPPPTRRNVLKVAAATATGLALPVGAGAPALASGADDGQVDRHLRRLYRRALDEGGRLVIYAGGDSPTQEDATRQAFTAAFPGIDTTIRVDLSKYHAPRIDRQLALGELEPDVAQLQTLHDFSYWKRKGVLLPYKSPDFGHVRRAYKDPDGAFVGITVYSFGRVSNTSLLSDAEAPRDASEFLAPRFRDQLVFTYPNDDDAVLYAFYLVVKKYGLQYMEELMKQRPEFVRGAPAALGAVASGQKLASFAGFAPLLPIPGLPVRYSVPRTDAFMSWAQTAAIFKQARHPNAAKLYIAWQLTRERQRQAAQWPVRRDLAFPPGWKSIGDYKTPLAGFRTFMRNRARVERFRGVIETFVGPVEGPSPLDG